MPIVYCTKKKFDVYIGRGPNSVWGNPFEIGKDGTRDEVVEKYRQWLLQQPVLLEEIHKLHGKTLGCWCHPWQNCHGKVILEIAEQQYNKKRDKFMKDLLGEKNETET
jgi:hypothetical protein